MMTPQIPTKIARNHFKCFQCRMIKANADGDWVDWDGHQVHLCVVCEKATKTHSERTKKN